jgi:tetratricopeptide (TPR) repeat protein
MTRLVLSTVVLVMAFSMPWALAESPSWRTLVDKGNELRRQGRFAEAEELYLLMLRELEKPGSEELGLAVLFNNLGALYQDLGRLAEAERLHLKSLSIRKKLMGNQAVELAPSLNNLAEVYRAQGRLSEAESLYRQALQLSDDTSPDDPALLATLSMNQGRLLQKRGHYAEAEALTEKRCHFMKRPLGKSISNWLMLRIIWQHCFLPKDSMPKPKA